MVKPVENLKPLEIRDAIEGLVPGMKEFDATRRAVEPALAWAFQAIFPRRVNAANEGEARGVKSAGLNLHFIPPDLVAANQVQSMPTMTSDALITA